MPRKVILASITTVALQFDDLFSQPEFINCLTNDRCFSAKTMPFIPFILTFCYRRFPMHQSFLEQVLLMHCLEVSENKAKYLGLQNVIWSIHIYKNKWLQLEGFITTWDQACKIVFLKNILEIHFHRNRNTFLPITRLNLHWEGDLCD